MDGALLRGQSVTWAIGVSLRPRGTLYLVSGPSHLAPECVNISPDFSMSASAALTASMNAVSPSAGRARRHPCAGSQRLNRARSDFVYEANPGNRHALRIGCAGTAPIQSAGYILCREADHARFCRRRGHRCPALLWVVRERFRQSDAADAGETLKSDAERLFDDVKSGICSEAGCEGRSREFQDASSAVGSPIRLIFH